MSITINGKVYRNLQEQVEKNKEDIEDINYTLLQDGEAISDLQEAMPYKQDKLTAGDNITIENNVISATGGGSEYTAGDGIDITDGVISNTEPGITYYAGTGINITDGDIEIDTSVVAQLSDIPTNYVTDNTAQTITGQKTFTDNTYFLDNKKLSFYNTDVSTYTKKVEVRSDSIIYTTSGTDKYRIKMIQGGFEQNYYFPLPDSNTGKTIALVDDFKRYFIAVDNGTSTVNIPITTFDKLTTGSSTYANIYKYLGNYMFAVEDHSLTEMNGEINSVTSSGFTFYYRDDNGQQQSINFTSTDSVTIGQ